MRGRAFLAIAVLVGALGSAARAELDVDEKKWLKQCVDSFGAKGERIRDGAVAAVAKLGLEAVPGLVTEVARLKTDDQWNALTKALELMGTKDAANAVDMARDKWPKGMEQRLGALVVALRAEAPAAKPDADVDAKVRELLDPFRTSHTYYSDNAVVRNVIALGRPAIPTLVALVREGEGGHGPGMLMMAVTDALARLVNESDVPVLTDLLTEGRLVAARAFEHLRSPAARDALLTPVKRGFVSHDLVEALNGFADDPSVAAALVAWLEAHGVNAGSEVASVANFVDDHHVASAVEPLLKIAAASPEPYVAARVGIALASLGRREGIETLLKVMDGGSGGGLGGHDDYPRRDAGDALNRIVGRRIYTGTFEPGGVSRGNPDEAAKQFRAWWDGVKGKIRFDETRRAWVVD